MTQQTLNKISGSNVIQASVPHSAEPLAIAQILSQKKGCLVHIAESDRAMERIETALHFFAPGVEVLRFPAWDTMPYDRVSPQAAIMAERVRTLSVLANNKPEACVILTTANAAIQRIPPKEALSHVALTLTVGQDYSQDRLVEALIRQGYQRNGKAMEPGEFALRGGILDLVAPGMTQGMRIDFFGNTIESIKPYDPFTQLSQGTIASIELLPVSEVLLNDDTRTRFRERYREQFGIGKDDPLYEAISHGTSHPGMEHWLPLFYSHTATLFDYCHQPVLTLDSESQKALEERWETITDYYGARKEAEGMKKTAFTGDSVYHPLPPDEMFVMQASWEVKLAKHEHVVFSPFNKPSPLEGEGWVGGMSPSIGSVPHPLTPSLKGRGNYFPMVPFTHERSPFDQLKERQGNGKSLLIACFTTGSRERIQTLLLEHEFHAMQIESWQDITNVRGKTIGLAILPLETGFETEHVSIISEQDMLGERITRAARKKKKSDVFLAEAASFAEGELVVHKEHGIGKFEGLVTLTVSGAAHDCMKLIYDGGDKLFIPVENIEVVSRFGLDEENVGLDKLGSASWQSRKAKLKEKILMSAEALLKIAAERVLKSGTVLEAQAGTYDDFVSRFPYMETEDQARAIEEVTADLRAGKPMDRLVCGDVGFGKTEVALRAAFVAVSTPSPLEGEGWGGGAIDSAQPSSTTPLLNPPPQGGRNFRTQVALIAPTTLLARQHFKNFKKRFDGFPVTVKHLSRMVPAREQEATREGLKNGTVDIVVGTHALLSKNVQFKSLGLMIVDEEQHFGVAQKEKLKEMKSGIHVLTLSATPIPRTLQMALTGVRDLSLITTPPVDRLAIRSFVMPFDPVVLREAIQREMHRAGKTFVVCPRIKDIADVKTQITTIVPEARLVVAHGQMAAAELDQIMNDFYDGKYDVLLSTTIIESGLDIEAANTMIIHNAHMFGLSQLYQLRGRVGRGKIRAYAYFLLPHHRLLSKNATRRLEVMQTLDTLGAGFTLASHDMDIRGFGNLVGEEQSGHIKEVGIELYQQMLEEAVASLRQGSGVRGQGSGKEIFSSDPRPLPPEPSDFSPSINLGLPVLIPETYIDDLQLRLGLYRRAAGMASEEEINSFAAELVDRFGPLPEETKMLIQTLGVKILCKRAGIERVDTGPKGAVLSFRNNTFAAPELLLTYVAKNAKKLKFRPDQKIVFTVEWQNNEQKLVLVKKLIEEIASLSKTP